MTYREPHFLDCTCQCESKRQLLKTLLNSFNELSISKQSFVLIYPAIVKPSRNIQYDEYQSIGVPSRTLVMRGNIGDLYIDKTPANYALYAKTSTTEWKKWPGPLSITNTLRHPLYPHYVLWCNRPARGIGWFFDFLVDKVNLTGSTHDIIHATLQKRREAEVKQQTRYKQEAKRKDCPSDDQEGTSPKKLKQTIKSPIKSVEPTSAPLAAISPIRKGAMRLKNAHTVLQELVATHPITSLAPDGSASFQKNVSNLLGSPLSHSSIPDGAITISRPSLDSTSPNPSKSDVPLSSLPQCVPNLRNESDDHTSANFPDDSGSVDEVLTILDLEKEANVNASFTVNNTDAINHNAFNESVMAMVDEPHQGDALDIYEHDSLVGQEIKINPPSHDVDCIAHDEPDNHCDIDTEREEDMSPKHQSGNQIRGIPVEGASYITTGAACPDLHSDKALESVAVTSDSGNVTSAFPHMNPPPTTPDQVVMKDVTPAPSNASNFVLNCSLKETIFHVSKFSEMICRLCLGTGSPEIHRFSTNVSLEELSDHCVKNHLRFCEVLWELRTEELESLKNKTSQIENLETHTILSDKQAPS